MRVAKQARRRVPEDFVRDLFLAVGRLADGVVAPLALLTLPAPDGEGHDDAVAFLELAVDARADLDDLAHHLVAHDVAGHHGRDEVVKEMQVGAADGAARHLDDGVAGFLDLRIGDRVVANIFFAVPDERLHFYFLLLAPLAGLGLLAVLFGEHRRRRDVGNRRLQLVMPAADDIPVSAHHCFETRSRDVGGIVLLALTDLGIEEVGALEEVGLGGPRHEASYSHARRLKFGAQSERKTIEKGLRGVVNGLIGAGHKSGDRPGNEVLPLRAPAYPGQSCG